MHAQLGQDGSGHQGQSPHQGFPSWTPCSPFLCLSLWPDLPGPPSMGQHPACPPDATWQGSLLCRRSLRAGSPLGFSVSFSGLSAGAPQQLWVVHRGLTILQMGRRFTPHGCNEGYFDSRWGQRQETRGMAVTPPLPL